MSIVNGLCSIQSAWCSDHHGVKCSLYLALVIFCLPKLVHLALVCDFLFWVTSDEMTPLSPFHLTKSSFTCICMEIYFFTIIFLFCLKKSAKLQNFKIWNMMCAMKYGPLGHHTDKKWDVVLLSDTVWGFIKLPQKQ